MKSLRRSSDRGHASHGWLESAHTFSFADYFDERFMGFRDLRVINEDRIKGRGGFPSHPHRDMEIITYVIEGALRHKDSMGNEATIYPGEVQIMSAGKGVVHSEHNASPAEEVHLLQIWINTDKSGLEPSYGQKSFAEAISQNPLTLVVSKSGVNGSVVIHQDVNLWVGKLSAGGSTKLELQERRHGWIQLIKGQLDIDGTKMNPGDGLAIDNELSLTVQASLDSEFLFFDLV
jgi:quercetin 2,3-dioxygenase